MFDIQFINNVFKETEILCMTPPMIESMKPLIDDNVGKEILDALDEFNGCGIREFNDKISKRITQTYDWIEEILGDQARLCTFSLEVQERGLFTFLDNFNVLDPFASVTDVVKLKSDIDWLLANKKFWLAEIKPREHKDFTAFLNQCKMLEYISQQKYAELTSTIKGIEFYTNPRLVEIIIKNSGFFYLPGEKPKDTKMRRIIARAKDFEELSKGVDWMNYCSENKIPFAQKRRLNF